MSLLKTEEAACPSCGASLRIDVLYSINGHRRPDLRAAVLEDRLLHVECPSCHARFRGTPDLSYVDTQRGEWILAEPADSVGEWKALEEAAHAIFERTYGIGAPAEARAVGRGLKPRVTFGWAGLREKVLCGHLGIDDVSLEIVKATILRAGGELPLADDVELRLTGADATTLTLTWLVAGTGVPVETVTVPRTLLVEVAGRAYEPLRDALTTGPYVDINRLLVAPA